MTQYTEFLTLLSIGFLFIIAAVLYPHFVMDLGGRGGHMAANPHRMGPSWNNHNRILDYRDAEQNQSPRQGTYRDRGNPYTPGPVIEADRDAPQVFQASGNRSDR